MTQSEEYGRRLHADERRLAYVALTRARYEALLTYSETNVEAVIRVPWVSVNKCQTVEFLAGSV